MVTALQNEVRIMSHKITEEDILKHIQYCLGCFDSVKRHITKGDND